MNIKCTSYVPCERDSLYENLSSEDPDRDLFLANNWGWDNTVPPIGRPFYKNWCFGTCESEISQDEADWCAARNALLCKEDPRPLYYNTEQQCSATCPGCEELTYVVPAGAFVEYSQKKVDLIAQTIACQKAYELACPSQDPRYTLCKVTSTSPLQSGSVGVSYSDDIAGTGLVQPYSFSIYSGSLPPGLTMDSEGNVTGTPTVAGTYTFTVKMRCG